MRRELVLAVVWLASAADLSMLVPAPLEGIANPDVSPNPAKAPWYFLGLQELLLHFHPLVGGNLIPAWRWERWSCCRLSISHLESVGVYFRSLRGRSLSLLAAGAACCSPRSGWCWMNS